MLTLSLVLTLSLLDTCAYLTHDNRSLAPTAHFMQAEDCMRMTENLGGLCMNCARTARTPGVGAADAGSHRMLVAYLSRQLFRQSSIQRSTWHAWHPDISVDIAQYNAARTWHRHVASPICVQAQCQCCCQCCHLPRLQRSQQHAAFPLVFMIVRRKIVMSIFVSSSS